MTRDYNPMADLFASWLDGGRGRRHDDYLNRGRSYSLLSDELLLRAWSIAHHCHEQTPECPDLSAEQVDLRCEMEIRGLRASAAAEYDSRRGWRDNGEQD